MAALTWRQRRTRNRLATLPGVRSIRRPVSPGCGERFDVYYLRTGVGRAHPALIIPGGPGMASIWLHRRVRRRAAAGGFDAIMVEHRGVGLSRRTDSGEDLPPAALTVDQVIDDLVAVLDDAGVDRAVVCGSSYGSYLAAGLGVRYPHRVQAMVLDSPVLSHTDMAAMRTAIRGLLLDGTDPATAALAPVARRLTDDGVLTPVGAQTAAVLYALGGSSLLARQLDLLAANRTLLWRILDRIGALTMRTVPFRNEPDLVSRIAFRELDFAGEPDGLPLDPAVAFREIAPPQVPFVAEPFDLVAELGKFDWPTVVISGGRDTTTPPVIADRVAELIPGAVPVRLATMGHGAFNVRERAAEQIVGAVCRGEHAGLPARAAELDRLPGLAPLRLATSLLRAATAVAALTLRGHARPRDT